MKKSGISSEVIIIITILICVAVVGVATWRLTGKKTTSPSESEENVKVKRIEIKTEAAGEILKYRQESLYSENNFAVILEDKGEFSSRLIENFKEKIIGVSAESCKVNFNRFKKSTVLACDIEGVTYDTDKYNMHFLLGNWPFDLYQFEEYEKKLVYDGDINKIPARVVFEFPYALDQCHEHV